MCMRGYENTLDPQRDGLAIYPLRLRAVHLMCVLACGGTCDGHVGLREEAEAWHARDEACTCAQGGSDSWVGWAAKRA